MKNIFILLIIALLCYAKTSYSQIVINEVCSSNDTIEVGNGTFDDWIELYNSSPEFVNLKGWSLSDNPKKPEKFTFKEDIVINPGGCKLVLCNGRGENLNTNFKISSEGETILLTNPDGEVADKITVPNMLKDRSFGRAANLEEWAVFDKATPGKSNSYASPLSKTPDFSLQAGFYTSAQLLEITCEDPSATIYYTLDGSTPTNKSPKYNGKINIGKTTVIRAVSIRQGYKNSETKTATFFINSREIKLPIVCLSTDDKYFWDNKIGFYVTGTNGISGNCSEEPRNWNRDWEYPVHFEYFDNDKKLQLSLDAGVKITGSCSRGNDQKSLKITARKKYGLTRLNYKFFPQKDISEFKSIVLRSGANDWCYTKTRDPLVSLLAGRNMNLDYQGYRACVVFLNGKYFGIHNIREKVSTHFIEENYGADDEKVNLLENEYSVIDGKKDDYYKNVHLFAQKNDLSKQENYETISRYMDIDNFIDYWITQIYIDNYDWPGNNIKFWNTDGKNSKWRWILFGSEYSSNLYGSKPHENSLARVLATNNSYWPPVQLWSNLVIRKLLENEDFKADFVQRFSYHIDNTFEYSRVKNLSDSLKNVIYDEWHYQIQRWPTWMGHSDWVGNIESMNQWYKNRPNFVIQNLKDYFNLTDRFFTEVYGDISGISFFVNNHNAGAEIKSGFFGGIKLKLKAQLPENKVIDFWEIIKNDSEPELVFEEEISVIPSSDMKITLHTKDNPKPVIPADYVMNSEEKSLVINEIQNRNCGTLYADNNSFPSWIEIFNTSEQTVDMAGMYLSDGTTYYMVPFYQPDLTAVSGKGKIVFFLDSLHTQNALHTNFTLKNQATTLTLYQNNGKKISEVKVPEMKKSQSYGCASDGYTNYIVFSKSTPYDDNSKGEVFEEKPLYTDVVFIENVKKDDFLLTVYPNPVKETIFIKTSTDKMPEYILTDMQGRVLLKGISNQINVQNLKSGFYLLRINGIVRKVVKL
ncbi:MAG: CotH kinase family protein [Bacteroidales bacterium]|nr:CotH kinase family protein [Bacteroidales bacterium]